MQQKDQQISCNIKININININCNCNCKININVNCSIVTSSCKIRNRTFRSRIMGTKGKVMRILRNYTSRRLKIHLTSHFNVNSKNCSGKHLKEDKYLLGLKAPYLIQYTGSSRSHFDQFSMLITHVTCGIAFVSFSRFVIIVFTKKEQQYFMDSETLLQLSLSYLT